MKDLLPFDLVPKHQPFDGEEVGFRLKPLDQRGFYEVQTSIGARGRPSWEGIEAATHYIVGWKGEKLGEFSRARVLEMLNGQPDSNWMTWLGEITGRLYRRALLEDDAAKKS